MAQRKKAVVGQSVTSSLARYHAKRDFNKTAEPSGRLDVAPASRLRFVIQKHAASHLHFDLRLELDGVFRSWAVTKGPSLDPATKRLAVEVEDHPLDYGDFEGTIPKGQYGGGTVQLWDRGFWAPLEGMKPEAALAKGELKFLLAGERLEGSWVLVRLKRNREGDKRTNWLLIKHRDEFADAQRAEALIEMDQSVASGRTMAQIASGKGKSPKPFMLAKQAMKADAVWQSNRDDKTKSVLKSPRAKPRSLPKSGKAIKGMPAFIEPQLCKLVERPPAAPGWAHEVKFDGYRVQLRVEGGKARMLTRSGRDWTDQFSALAQSASGLPDCIVDGEVCALNPQQMPDFAALQAALSAEDSRNLVYFAFDLLIEEHEDLRLLPLSCRKARLEKLLEDYGQASIRYVAHFESAAESVLSSACKMQLEGIISKRLDGRYQSGRSAEWTKSKCRAGHEVVLGGWTTEAGGLRSLLAGVNRDGHLVYVGRIGTGYSAEVASKLLPTLNKLTRPDSPFGGANAPKLEKNIRWLEPSLVAEIEFAGWTATGMIRQAAFKGLRKDKAAKDVVAEMPSPVKTDADVPDTRLASKVHRSGRAKSQVKATTRSARPTGSSGPAVVMGVTLSKPEKVFWPDAGDGKPVTKADLAHYYGAVGDWTLSHLKGRPCSLVRAPDGLSGEQFFQRHAMAGISNLFSLVKIRGDKAPYVQIDRVEALAAVAQIGALEIHPWNCAPGNPEVAGRLVFDLDPAPDVPFKAVITAALEIRDRLKDVGLESFCKTTGGKGLHVVTPLTGGKGAVPWPAAKDFAHIICAQMAQDSPKKYLDTMAKKDRVGRIFLDYLRNDRTSTAVSVLSSRVRPGAPISMPVHWKDVKTGLDPSKYTVRSGPAALVKSKPWEEYDDAQRSLSDAIRRVTESA